MQDEPSDAQQEQQRQFIPNTFLNLPEKYAHLSPTDYLSALIHHIESYRHVINVHIGHFITHQQWELLDEDWRSALLPDKQCLSNSEEWIESLIRMTTDAAPNADWPDSLKSFILKTRELALPRQNGMSTQQVIETLDKRITPGMTSKKIHEVERMAPVIKELAAEHKVASIVDLGAGQGYLSRALAFKTNLKVLAVDSSAIQTCGAKRFDEKVAKFLKKQDKILQLHHVTELITPDNASSVLSKWDNDHHLQQKEDGKKETTEKWLLTGLHTCGDLASMMLTLFATHQEMTCFVNVGCCYHFLTEQSEDRKGRPEVGFPLSSGLKRRNYRLGSKAAMLSCQAPVRWTDQPQETRTAFEHHFFRALLQLIMVEKGLTDITTAPIVGRLNNKKDFTSFPVYVKAALHRLKMPIDSITEEEAQAYYDQGIQMQADQQITIFWTLRALLAPVLESIILVDRWLYLTETIEDSPTKQVYLWPLFDPILSPRNMVIVATK
ncbi:methyltransferase domain-containing protein [Mycotypha africana]|uniref:methyltransferase domain-containing protein n=1 Tax=Mycotypha africana TaxID=64632 RepID=UPI0022FFF34E|nr:methyltransferase domain-containing protein [Mycotypha africana]KAI8984618.1 methyltransferase domain-containing protein [Mycotypha africana]